MANTKTDNREVVDYNDLVGGNGGSNQQKRSSNSSESNITLEESLDNL